MSKCTCQIGGTHSTPMGHCPVHGAPMPYHAHTSDAVDVRPEIRDAPAVTMTLGEARRPGGILDAIARIAKRKDPLA